MADVIRAVEGPLADVHGAPPEEAVYEGAAVELQRVWIATRVALREVLETTTLADIAVGLAARQRGRSWPRGQTVGPAGRRITTVIRPTRAHCGPSHRSRVPMPRRIDIELTSSRDDGSWTWRAAGAKEPRGTRCRRRCCPASAKVGDVLRVDAEFFVDGIEITGVLPPKGPRQEPERLELLVPAEGGAARHHHPHDAQPRTTAVPAARAADVKAPAARVTATRGEATAAATDRKDRSERGDRPERKDRPPRRTRPEPPPMPVVERPKAKRLRAGKAHRTALLESLPEEQRPIAEQVVLGGLPAVRQAIEKQNAERTAAGEAPIAAGPLLELAEKLVPKVRAAEWRDRAEAAQRDLEVLDLRDLRSVVSTADAAAKDDETRALAQAAARGTGRPGPRPSTRRGWPSSPPPSRSAGSSERCA